MPPLTKKFSNEANFKGHKIKNDKIFRIDFTKTKNTHFGIILGDSRSKYAVLTIFGAIFGQKTQILPYLGSKLAIGSYILTFHSPSAF